MTFEIKPATKNDVPLILNFIKELAAYEKLPHEVIATNDSLNETLFGEKANTEVVIGYLHGAPVSFAVYFHNYSSFLGRPGLYLEDIYVKPEERGKGLGKKLFSYIAKIAVERHCGRFEWSVLDWNEPAINFYKKLGAKAMDQWTVYRITGKALQELAMGNDCE